MLDIAKTAMLSTTIMAKGKADKKVLTVQEFHDETGVATSTIRHWLNVGDLKGTKIGRIWLIPLSELERILNPK